VDQLRGVPSSTRMLSTDGLLDLLDHAIEPETWECDEEWEYRAMHWRPSEPTSQVEAQR
jgi:hypothetical protein